MEKARTISIQKGISLYTLKYEDLILNPDEKLNKLFQYLEFDDAPKKVRASSKLIKPDRIYAYKNNDELVEFSNKVLNELDQFGY